MNGSIRTQLNLLQALLVMPQFVLLIIALPRLALAIVAHACGNWHAAPPLTEKHNKPVVLLKIVLRSGAKYV